MWNKLLAVNSFIIWPIAFIFMVYAAGRAILVFEWKMLVVAVVIFAIFCVVEIVLAIMSD